MYLYLFLIHRKIPVKANPDYPYVLLQVVHMHPATTDPCSHAARSSSLFRTWQKRSAPPSSGAMNPKPFCAFHRFATPVAIICDEARAPRVDACPSGATNASQVSRIVSIGWTVKDGDHEALFPREMEGRLVDATWNDVSSPSAMIES